MTNFQCFQMHAFTCGVDDLLLLPESDMDREVMLAKSEAQSEDVHFRFTGTKHGDIGEFIRNAKKTYGKFLWKNCKLLFIVLFLSLSGLQSCSLEILVTFDCFYMFLTMASLFAFMTFCNVTVIFWKILKLFSRLLSLLQKKLSIIEQFPILEDCLHGARNSGLSLTLVLPCRT